MTEHNIKYRVKIQSICNALGISVEELISPDISSKILMTDECLRLWSHLETQNGRERALDALRRVIDDEAAQAKPDVSTT